MGLSRVFSSLSQVLIRRLGDGAGPRADQVNAELDNIIAWAATTPRVISTTFTNVGNVGGGLDTLHSFSLPAASLAMTNDWVRSKYSGLFATNDNNKRLVFAIDGQTILDTGLQDFDLGVSTLVGWTAWTVYGRLSATSVAATAHISVEQLFVDGAGAIVGTSNGAFMNKYNNLTVSNLTSNAVNITVQGEGTANSDVDIRMAIHELWQQ